MKVRHGLFSFIAVFNLFFFSSLFAVKGALLGPQLVGNAEGVVAMWSAFNGSEYAIYEARLPIGEEWSAPVQISQEKVNCFYPSLAMNSTGTILSAWQRAAGAIPDIQFAFNTFSDLHSATLSSAAFYCAEHLSSTSPISCLDDAGNGSIIWEGHSSSGYVMLGTECTPSNTRSPVISLCTVNSQHISPDLVVKADSGDAFVIWQAPFRQIQLITVASVSVDGTITGPVPISSFTTSSFRPVFSLSSDGSLYAAFCENTKPYSTIKMTQIGEGLTFSLSTLSLDNAHLTAPRIGANAAEEILLVAKATFSNGNSALVTAVKEGSSWSQLATLSDPSTTSVATPVVALNDAGQGVALWQDTSTDKGVIWAAVYTSHAWGAPTPLSSPDIHCSAPALYVDPTGYAVASWMVESQNGGAIEFITQAIFLPSFAGPWELPLSISLE